MYSQAKQTMPGLFVPQQMPQQMPQQFFNHQNNHQHQHQHQHQTPVVGQKILDQSFDFQSTAIIRPPELDKKDRKLTRIMIDSRDRNTKIFPSPAQYEIALSQEIEDAVAVTILIADVPHTAYLINLNNNLLHVRVGGSAGTVFVAEVPIGNYTPTELGTAVEAALNLAATGASVTITFNVSYTPRTDKYTFVATAPFEFICNDEDKPYGDTGEMRLSTDASGNTVRIITGSATTPYKPQSIAKVLGFPRELVASDGAGYLPAPFRKNFTDADFIVMHIEHMRLFQSTTTHVNKSIMVLHRKTPGELTVYSDDAEYRAPLYPPMPRLNKIKVTFMDAWGNLYDFQNYDHRFEVLVESSKQKGKYSGV